MSAKDYRRTLRGLTLNLLVRDIDRALEFYRVAALPPTG